MWRRRLFVLAWLLGAGFVVAGAVAVLSVPASVAGPKSDDTGG
jgi:hypothetical protein